MSKKNQSFILIILAIIVWLLILNKNNRKISSPSTKQSSSYKNPSTPPKSKAPQTQTPEKIVIEINDFNNQVTSNRLTELSYLELYEILLDAKACSGFYIFQTNLSFGFKQTKEEKDIDYLQIYKDGIGFNSNQRQQDTTEKQIQSYQDYVEHCQEIKNEVSELPGLSNNQANNTKFIQNELQNLLRKTNAVTDEEKELKTTLKMVKWLNLLLFKIANSYSGEIDLPKKELDKLNNEIEFLEREMASIENYGITDKEKPTYLEIKKQCDLKKAFIKSHTPIKNPNYEQYKKDFFSVINNLNSRLRTKYSHVFTVTFNALNYNYNQINILPNIYMLKRFKKMGVEFPFISMSILNKSPIKNKDYFNNLLQPALELYKCYLGNDCTFPNNRHLASLCFQPNKGVEQIHQGLFYEACEMNLENFYLQNYLTDNQVEDMIVLFDHLVNNYAK